MKRRPLTPAERTALYIAAVRRHRPGHCVFLVPRDELPSLADAPAELATRGVRCVVCGQLARASDTLVFNFDGAP